MILESEFARVNISVDTSGNGPRLRIEDLWSGAAVFLDPLALESLVWARPDIWDALADPGRRWSGEPSSARQAESLVANADLAFPR